MIERPIRRNNRRAEHGNVFIFILLGVVLFAALSYTVARSMRSDTASNISKQQATLAASEIINHAQRIERAINRMRRNGISESDISFANSFVSGYEHTPIQPDTNRIFEPQGGNITYLEPEAKWLANFGTAPDLYGEWYFPDATRIHRLGPNGQDNSEAHNDGISNEDLIAVLPYIKQDICIAINKRLSVSADNTIPQDSNSLWEATEPKFTGTFTDSGLSIEGGGSGLANAPAACIEGNANPAADTYHFYYALILR